MIQKAKALLDGAYFGGPSFPHILLLNSPYLLSTEHKSGEISPGLFGFRINK
jgi:hypothetical protein